MDKRHYLLNWGMNFVEKEGKPRKSLVGKVVNKPRLNLNQSTMLTEDGFQSTAKRVDIIKRKNVPIDYQGKRNSLYQRYNSRTNGTRLVIGPGGKYGIKIQNDISDTKKINKTDIIKKRNKADNSEGSRDSRSSEEKKLPNIDNTNYTNTTAMDLQEESTSTNLATNTVSEKIRQFPYLKDFFTLQKTPEPNTRSIVALGKYGGKCIDKCTPDSTMGTYILLDPENDEHHHYGYIYLDEMTKVSNHHFYNFKPEKYVKPPAVIDICKQVEHLTQEANKDMLLFSNLQNKWESQSDSSDIQNLTLNPIHSSTNSPSHMTNPTIKDSNTHKTDGSYAGLINAESGFDMYTNHVNFRGTWNAELNIPIIPTDSSILKSGEFYIVTHPGNIEINGISDWKVGSALLYSDSKGWIKV